MSKIEPLNEENNIEIHCSRELNYPLELVWKAWSNPEYLKIWWGPNGFTNTFNTFEFKVRGKWSFIMHGPEKGNYKNECEFTEIIPLSSISWKRHSPPLFNFNVRFSSISSRTTYVIFRQIFETVEECEKIKKYVLDKNEENFDRLEEVLRTMKL